MLRELMENASHVVTREQLIRKAAHEDRTGPDDPRHIVTIPGVGYRFNDGY